MAPISYRTQQRNFAYRALRILSLGWVSVVMVACASATGPEFTGFEVPAENEAVLYIYRPKSFIGSGAASWVYIDDVKHAKLLNGGYQVHRLEPGVHTIVTDASALTSMMGRAEGILDAEPGETYFIKFAAHADGTLGGMWSELELMSPAIAIEQLRATNASMD